VKRKKKWRERMRKRWRQSLQLPSQGWLFRPKIQKTRLYLLILMQLTLQKRYHLEECRQTMQRKSLNS
jgi:hypothetical protein